MMTLIYRNLRVRNYDGFSEDEEQTNSDEPQCDSNSKCPD
jgi:hypothetical protein